ncbi:MAG: flagellar biosynthetic protein FliR [Verrucomicrobia bacterium]|jgi:flagellar biosynthetic protein FliR|nr:flagellar biosynthetic protein FliR [Verrucomicrobiota bacterium]
MSVDFLVTWVMVLLRALGIILQLPVLAGHPIPIPVRVGIAVCLANLVVGLIPPSSVDFSLWPLLAAAAREVLVGLAMGFVVRLTFGAVEMAGRVISSEVGFNATPGMGVPEPSSEPLAALLGALAVVLFFLFGGHHGVLTAFVRSFHHVAAGRPLLAAGADSSLVAGTAAMIELGFRIAAPFIAMNFLVTLAFAVLARAVPRTNVFIVSLPARSLLGLGLLGTAGSLVARYLYVEFGDLPLRMLHLLPGR